MKENLSKKSLNFGPTQNFVKCPKLVREAPRATQKIKKILGPKGPWAQFWALEAAALEVGGMRRQPLKFGEAPKGF